MGVYMRRDGEEWQQSGENVRYLRDDEKMCYYLEFEYEFKREGEWVEVSTMPAYPYSRLNRFIDKSAGINHHYIGIFVIRHHLVIFGSKLGQNSLRIHQGFGAAERNKAYFGNRGFFDGG